MASKTTTYKKPGRIELSDGSSHRCEFDLRITAQRELLHDGEWFVDVRRVVGTITCPGRLALLSGDTVLMHFDEGKPVWANAILDPETPGRFSVDTTARRGPMGRL